MTGTVTAAKAGIEEEEGEIELVHILEEMFVDDKIINAEIDRDDVGAKTLFNKLIDVAEKIDNPESSEYGDHTHVQAQLTVISGKNLLLVESTRFRILKIDVVQLLDNEMKGICGGKASKSVNCGCSLLDDCGEKGSLAASITSPHSSLVSVYLDGAPGIMDNIRLCHDM